MTWLIGIPHKDADDPCQCQDDGDHKGDYLSRKFNRKVPGEVEVFEIVGQTRTHQAAGCRSQAQDTDEWDQSRIGIEVSEWNADQAET